MNLYYLRLTPFLGAFFGGKKNFTWSGPIQPLCTHEGYDWSFHREHEECVVA